MYVAYVRSVFDYAVPVWYPLMTATNMKTLQWLQNKALHKSAGVPLSTRVHDLHLESNVILLAVRYEATIAYQAEKYRRHPSDDPLHILAHAQPPSRLKRKTRQHYSDDILSIVHIDHSHNTTTPPLESNSNSNSTTISLHSRQPLHATSCIAPWTSFGTNIKIVSKIPNLTGAHNGRKRELASEAVETLGPFDLTLWTDGRISENEHGGSACISFNPNPISNPYKKKDSRTLFLYASLNLQD